MLDQISPIYSEIQQITLRKIQIYLHSLKQKKVRAKNYMIKKKEKKTKLIKDSSLEQILHRFIIQRQQQIFQMMMKKVQNKYNKRQMMTMN